MFWDVDAGSSMAVSQVFGVQGVGFRFLGFRVWCLGFRFQGVGSRAQDLGFRV